MKIKAALHAYCLELIEERIERIKLEIGTVQSSANEETKSSAGDKYETGRAMAQQEVELRKRQLAEVETLLSTLLNFKPKVSGEVVVQGSLVSTSTGVFYLTIGIGLVTFNRDQYYVISPDSPIGKQLLGKKPGDTVVYNKVSHIIHSIE
jgi:transcription elongation GreA/GreB family factor